MVCGVIAYLLCGCISMPTKTEPFCYPQGKYNRDTKQKFIGIKCHW